MNKLMLGAAAVALVFGAGSASAADDSGVKLGLGGYFKGYANYADYDNNTNQRKTDLLRDTEIHFGGETTLDNGLTVGAHVEATADAADAFALDESYVYASGAWGRVNVGEEDAAAYLLQVSTPGADDNVDGLRPTITVDSLGGLGYANDMAKEGDKLTYLSPVFSGLQFGASYTPHVAAGTSAAWAGSGANRTNLNTGVTEAGVRYEGMVSNVGVIAGAGYAASTKNDKEWNAGVDLDVGAFGVGVAYLDQNAGVGANPTVAATNPRLITADSETWNVGADYTTGPFKLGASYQNTDVGATDTDRYRAGVVYSYGPGMTFRGSVGYADNGTNEATTVTVGSQINF